ncbi:phospholipase D-like domain-containing protein [Halomicronema hongdechloris]|uniref:phospholipase D-like domain-containing protein n=1 Tax=Halomicronema hongdechloris TaxID=1209493 RepID=UPI001CED5B71|nr:phospholipase D-like domain-containing protein [Halomicronema hongdechloris]
MSSFSSGCKWGVLGAVSLLFTLTVGRWQARDSLPPALDPLPQDPQIQVYFNQVQSDTYRDAYRDIERYGDDLEHQIIAVIEQARVSIDVAVHELNLPGIAQALRERSQAGVAVRVILEDTYSRSWSQFTPTDLADLDGRDRTKYEDFLQLTDGDGDGQLSPDELSQRDALYILQQAQIPILDDTADGSKGSGLMHHKFMVVDGRYVVTGSANWTLSGIHGDLDNPDSRGNTNHIIVLDSVPVARIFQQEFTYLWGDGPGGAPDSLFGLGKPYRPAQTVSLPGSILTVQFSPTSSSRPWTQSGNGLIDQILRTATQQVSLALFVFSDQPLSDTLAARSEAGVEVSALIDPSFVYRGYSEALDMLGLAMPDHRCQYEANNRPWPSPILTVGTAELPPGDKLHHKFAVIDSNIVISGSQNWSQAANQLNDENLVVIHNPTVAAHFQREFDRLYNLGEVGITPELQVRLQKQRRKCNL